MNVWAGLGAGRDRHAIPGIHPASERTHYSMVITYRDPRAPEKR